MLYYKCGKCGAKCVGWGCSGVCQECGNKMRKISRDEFYANERIEEIEDDIADLKLQTKVNEYKEKYPEHFKEQ